MRTFQYLSESGGLRNPQTSAQMFGIDPGPHNGAGPGGVGNAQSAKASSIVLLFVVVVVCGGVVVVLRCLSLVVWFCCMSVVEWWIVAKTKLVVSVLSYAA